MKKLILILMMTLGTSCSMLFSAPFTEKDSRFTQFDEYLSEINKACHIPGMAFVLTDSEKTLFARSYGQCKSLDQLFFIGSMSKSYTALCIMQLAEKGLINIDNDISFYLPEYKFEKPVTLRSLLNHTSGFDTHMKLSDGKKLRLTENYGKYEYANVNYDLLGKIIEAVTGLSYEAYISQNVFIPLGMTSSKANAASLKNSPQLLQGNRNYFGFFKKGAAAYPEEKSWFHEPAGYLAITPNEHAKYLRMYLNGGLTEQGWQIIKKESIDSMWYENVSLGVSQYDAYYGKGWNLMNYKGQKIIFHGGQVENTITYQFILPEEKLAACFMINGNDQFGMNSLTNNVFWNSLEIIKGNSPAKVNHASYILIHAVLDLFYLLILFISIFILIKAIKGKKSQTAARARRILKISLSLLSYLVWPILLLTFTKLFIDTPLWVVRSFVPDLYVILLLSSSFAFAGGVIKLLRKLFISDK